LKPSGKIPSISEKDVHDFPRDKPEVTRKC